jgi:hypothetical protein
VCKQEKWEFHGKQSPFLQIKDELYAYIMDLRKAAYAVPSKILHLGASKTAQKFNTPVTKFRLTISGFNGSTTGNYQFT